MIHVVCEPWLQRAISPMQPSPLGFRMYPGEQMHMNVPMRFLQVMPLLAQSSRPSSHSFWSGTQGQHVKYMPSLSHPYTHTYTHSLEQPYLPPPTPTGSYTVHMLRGSVVWSKRSLNSHASKECPAPPPPPALYGSLQITTVPMTPLVSVEGCGVNSHSAGDGVRRGFYISSRQGRLISVASPRMGLATDARTLRQFI